VVLETLANEKGPFKERPEQVAGIAGVNAGAGANALEVSEVVTSEGSSLHWPKRGGESSVAPKSTSAAWCRILRGKAGGRG
jgi:hypothetical protein